MDQKKLEQKLNEIAVWVYPSVSNDTSIERIVPTSGGKEFKHTFTPKPDLGPRIIKIRDDKCLRPCEWCGKILDQKQNITKKLIPKDELKPAHLKWQYSCYNCHRLWDDSIKELKPVSKTIERKRLKKSQK